MEQETSGSSKLCTRLAKFVAQVGVSNGIQLATNTRPIALDIIIITNLEKWLKKPANPPHALWIQAPFEPGRETSAQAVAIRFVQILRRAKAPFISCVCRRPIKSMIPDFQGTEGEAGILAMVYCLILQLLEFGPPGCDQVQLDENELPGLVGDIGHWKTALNIFATLLNGAPNLRYCNISGLDALEHDAKDKCRDFLNVLFSRTRPMPLQIFLTASGFSKLLKKYVDGKGHVVTQLTLNELKRGGTLGHFSGWYDSQSSRADNPLCCDPDSIQETRSTPATELQGELNID